MTPILFLGHAVLSVALLAGSALDTEVRDRFTRAVAGVGVVSGLATFLFRSGLSDWRGLAIAPGDAALAGVAVACTWGLVIALDLGTDRWWAGALAGVAATGLLLLAATQWTVPALLFLGCISAAASVALARSRRASWLSIAAGDGALAAVLISDALSRDGWSAPVPIGSALLAPLLVSSALRAGIVPRVGPLGALGSPAAVMSPITAAVAFVSISRWVERPLPLPAAAVLVLALAVAAWSVLHRRLDPALIGVWPAALTGALALSSQDATTAAGLAGIVGLTLVTLWPDALERGRLSRGVVLSGIVPTIAFGALAVVAREAFVHATGRGATLEVAAWVVVSALLPAALATGVALGVFIARSETRGGYHPEAVFMTWVLLGASIVGGFALGAGEAYDALGGGPAAMLFGIAGIFGAAAAIRTDSDAAAGTAPSARVTLSDPLSLGRWADGAALALHVFTVVGIAWFTIEGLQVGFL